MIFIIVESPTKAKAINEYLKGEKVQYKALSTYGHIRNLVTKSGSIDVDHNYKYAWKTTLQWEKHKKDILENAKMAEKIIVASDLDREGEGIAWHFLEMLKAYKINTPTERIVFNSLSKEAIKNALNNACEVRTGLIESYLARIGLDYLFGFSISPLLWRKVPCCKSAGRVQSVALRIIVEREDEIKNFISKDYQTIHSLFKENKDPALLVQLDGEQFENGNIFDKKINLDDLKGSFQVAEIKKQKQKQSAPAPFITSSLQQAASGALNFSPTLTMQLAQKLYEGFKIDGKHVGLITYMRTDSININPEFIGQIRDKIKEKYGEKYLPSHANAHKTTTKNAQEAHEAIRVTQIDLDPSKVNLGDKNLDNLYKLIWNRTMASQMSESISENTTLKIAGKSSKHESIFELKSSKLIFDGFKILQQNEDEEEVQKSDFSNLSEKQILNCEELFAKEHKTQPPKRYSEAMLINQIKKKGIGRPSTYARIIQVLYEREYAVKEKKIIVPTQKGWIVTAYLKSNFQDEVAYEFTSSLEDDLDNLNQTNGKHTDLLDKFWKQLHEKIKVAQDKNPLEVAEKLQHEFANYFLSNEKECSECKGKMMLKVTRFGAMLGCENYPTCKNVVNIDKKENIKQEPNFLGVIDGADCLLKTGPYGPYIELIQATPKRIPIPKIWQDNLEEFSLDKAKLLASLPKEIDSYEGEKLILSIGRFGPFIKYGSNFISIKDPSNVDIDDVIKKIQIKIKAPAKSTAKPTFKKTTKTKPTAKE